MAESDLSEGAEVGIDGSQDMTKGDFAGSDGGFRDLADGVCADSAGGCEDLGLFFSTSLDLLCIADPEGRFIRLSPEWERTLGYPLSELVGRRAIEFMHPEDVDAARAAAVNLGREGSIVDHTVRYLHKDGSFRWLDWRARFVKDRIYASARDRTAKMELEEALKQKEEENQNLFLAVPQPMWVYDQESLRFLAVNDAAVTRYGWSRDEFLSMTVLDIRTAEDAARLRAAIAALPDEGRSESGIWTHRTRDGIPLTVEIFSHPLKFRGRRARVVLANDLTDRMADEHRLRLQEAALRAAANAIVITDRSGVIQWTNPAFSDVTGYSVEEGVGRKPGDLLKSGEHGPAFYRAMWDTILGGRVWQGQVVNRKKDGSRYVEEQTITPVEDDTGTITHFVSIKQDVTQRIRVEEELKRSEARYHGLFRDSHAVMLLVDPEDQVILEANPAAAAYYGLPVDRLEGMRLTEIEADPPQVMGHRGDRGSPGPRPARHRVAGGGIREVEVFSGPVEVEERSLLYAIVHDVTDRVNAEAQLRQAQKMESVGRLAGGVAHDFNNILTVINTTAELASEALVPDHPLREELEEIREAGGRAAVLTRQLLTFSRQEIARRKLMDLNTVVEGMDRLLRRVIGEDVRIQFRPGPALQVVRVDPGHVEQVIMNLAVNARDAMPGGGELTIETANTEVDEVAAAVRPNLTAGSYVVLSVSDTGVGMDQDTQDRMFEPFFSTKPADQGTGLGLSTVYGIVRESGGGITVYSEPGEGTTVRVYLPALDAVERTERPPARLQLHRGSESILLVEDDASVRSVTARVLRAAGYQVTEAENGAEALVRFRELGGSVDLVLTDLVMPGISGHELAQKLEAESPGMKFLFTSGHTADALTRRKLGERRVHFVGKPFTAAELTRSVRKVLAGS